MAVQPFPIGLPSGVRLDTLKEQAKDLLKSADARDDAALVRIKPYFRDPAALTLQRTQLVIAREHGFSSWRKLKDFGEARDELLIQRRELQQKDRRPFSHEKLREMAALAVPFVQRMASAVGIDDPDDSWRCGFCFKSQHDVSKFIVGSSYFICDECVATCTDLVNSDGRALGSAGDLRCNFCTKHAREVRTIVAGGGTNICNECVELCVTIIAEGSQADSS